MLLFIRHLAEVTLLSVLIVPVTVHAQETLARASVTGRVLDPSGAVVPNSTVKALAVATNQIYTVQADEQGRFRIPYLPVGQYRISAQASGFAESSRQIRLTVGSAFDLTLQLALASAATSIEVTSEPAMIEANRSQVGQTVLEPEIQNLPQAWRSSEGQLPHQRDG